MKSEYGTRNAEDSLRFQSPLGDPVDLTLTRRYAAVVQVQGQVPSGKTKWCEMQLIRFVNVNPYLDIDQPDGDTIQFGQAHELIGKFASADMPIIVMGDM